MIIEINGLNKTYNSNKQNKFQALKNIHLEIAEGELVAIIGASGAGKSTLLHIIGGIEKFDSGSYLLDGQEVGKMKDKRLSSIRSKKIGFVLQDFGLINDETVLKNVCMPLYFDDTKISEIKKKGLAALEQIGISDLKQKKVNQLSGGQKQRVAIARAIVNSPRVILADEPTGALDTETSKEIMGVFKALNSKGTTIIIVTHEMDIANSCRRIVKIRDGKLVED